MRKVLIIDDEKPVRIAIQKLVDWTKYNVSEILTASNGKEGLEIMRTGEPEYIFLDICMPIMNGLEFLEAAKEEYPRSQFIIVSGYDDFQYAQKALRYGACDYLLKPIDRDAINNALGHAEEKLLAAIEDEKFIENEKHPNFSEDTPKLSTDQVVQIIYDYIQTHYPENIKISMFSEKYYFSKEYISRHFKSTFGHGIYEMVLMVRMENAAALLKDDSIMIQDVGARVGFTDNNYFSKAFKNYYNVSPTEYRKEHCESSL